MKRVAIELKAPDIRRWERSNTGIPYVHSFANGTAGPHVMVNAITHGNEICGAIAVNRLLEMASRGELVPHRGRLTLSFANVEAFHRFDENDPFSSRFVDEDFNRVWEDARLAGSGDSSELRRARALQPIVADADLLLDIHSMLEPSPPVMICGPHDKGIRFAHEVGLPHWIVSDRGHANGTRMRDYGGFGDPASPKNALLVECGQHWEARAERVAWQTAWRFLKQSGVVHAAAADAHIDRALNVPAKVVKVSEAVVARAPDFRFAREFRGMEVLPHAGEIIAHDGDHVVTSPYDNCVLVMPVPNNIQQGLTAVRLGRLVA